MKKRSVKAWALKHPLGHYFVSDTRNSRRIARGQAAIFNHVSITKSFRWKVVSVLLTEIRPTKPRGKA